MEQLKQQVFSLPDTIAKYQRYKEQQKKYFDQGAKTIRPLNEKENIMVQEGTTWRHRAV